MSGYNNFSSEYKKNSIETAPPITLVVMLYEGAIRFIDEAIEKMEFSTYDKVNYNISRAKDIVLELQSSLNFEMGGEISDRLNALYFFVLDKLREANIDKKVKPLEEAKGVLSSLLSSWQELQNSKGNSPTTDNKNSEDKSFFSDDDLDGITSFSIEG